MTSLWGSAFLVMGALSGAAFAPAAAPARGAPSTQPGALEEARATVARLAPRVETLDAGQLLQLAEAQEALGEVAAAEDTLRHGQERLADSEALWLARIDLSLRRRLAARALRQCEEAAEQLGSRPELNLRAARAYLALGRLLDDPEVRELPDAEAGQFVDGRFVIEPRGADGAWLVCGPKCAMYEVQLALNAGMDDPAACLLLAQIWSEMGRSETALAVLESRRAALLEPGFPQGLEALTEAARDAGDIAGYLRYVHLAAERYVDDRSQILAAAYLECAELAARRGEVEVSVGFLRRAVRTLPEDDAIRLRAADAAWAAEARTLAGRWYRELLERKPQHAERRRLLDRLEVLEAKPDLRPAE